MKTEKGVFNQNELTPEELCDVIDITSYLLNYIENEEVFDKDFDPSKPSQVLEYKKTIEGIPFEYREENIKAFEKHYIGKIFLDGEMGVVIEAIRFYEEENKDLTRIRIPVRDVCNKLGLNNMEILDSPNYQNFIRAIEYLQKDIQSKESLKRFLDNPGVYFKYGRDRSVIVKKGGSPMRVSLHEKDLNIPNEERSSVDEWEYVKTFEYFNKILFFDPQFTTEFLSRLVENYLKNEDLGEYSGIFCHLKSGDLSIIMIVNKED